MNKIGIARALSYYIEPFQWDEFFKILNCDVIISDNLSENDAGLAYKIASSDQCFPVKLFYGHVLSLKDRVDYLFIPQLVSLRKGTYSCPKIISLPLLIQNTLKGIPKILFVSIDLNNKVSSIYKVIKLALSLNKNPIRIIKAVNFFIKKLKCMEDVKVSNNSIKEKSDRNVIGLIGHKYALNDKMLNMNLINRINDYGFDVITLEDLENSIDLTAQNDNIFNCKAVHWDFGQNIITGIEELLKSKDIKGIIFLTFFGCGIDAFVEEIFKVKVSENKPYICLTMDEHTGEAGLVTRIEAFLDMIVRKEMVQ